MTDDAMGGRESTRDGGWPVLERNVRASAALAHIGRAQLAVLAASEARIRAGGGAKPVHDARVALRRMRSLYGQLKGVLRKGARKELCAELRWLGRRLGPLRDLDTLRARLRGSAGARRAAGKPLAEHLERERARRLGAVRAVLASKRHARLHERLVTRGSDAHGRRAAERFRRVVAPRIERRLVEVTELAHGLGPDTAPGVLHALRIACKELRYLVAACRGLVARPLRARLLADLKALQDALGRIQDAEVHARLVERLARTLDRAAHARSRRGLERLRAHVLADGRAARARYTGSAAALAAPASRARFARLLTELAR
jgi:CHAD domain-containing protein